MGKAIVFCADGTWNGPGTAETTEANDGWTNVFKLFNNLAGENDIADSMLANEQERTLVGDDGKTVAQIAKYLHGVGDSSNELVHLLGGAVGAGLIARVIRGYTFASRNYVPGDRIFLVGFSRGAYTARALGGLIAKRGLLANSPANGLTDKGRAYRLGAAVWYDYRRHALATQPTLADRLAQLALDLPAFLSIAPVAEMVVDVPMAAIAVWDTVGAFGIPVYAGDNVPVDLFEFADRALSPKVSRGFHAIAADEERADFCPTFWDRDPRIIQCLYPGAHCDVGGGYPIKGESGLSDAPLTWITAQLQALGVAFAATARFPAVADPTGLAHRPCDHFPFDRLRRARRIFPVDADLRVSSSLLKRLSAGPVPVENIQPDAVYQPDNLGGIVNGQGLVEGVLAC